MEYSFADWLTPDDWTAVFSLRIAFVALAGSLPFGILVAYALARWHFPGKTLITALIYLPLVLPPVVTGYMLLIGFGRRGIFGQALADVGIVLSFRWTGAALACAIMGFPLMVRAIRLSFEATDPNLEKAASTLGANPFFRFLLVSLPLAFPGIIMVRPCPSPARSANSVRRSLSSPIFPARRKRSRHSSTLIRRSRAAMRMHCI